MKNIMIDIETLGNGSNSAILSIAAIYFDLETGLQGDEFIYPVSLESCLELGLKIDSSTFKWWLTQNETARNEIAKIKGIDIKIVLDLLADFIDGDCKVWGNSARFDLGILSDAYAKIGKNIPWDFRNEMCVRTLSALVPEIKQNHKYTGTAHSPLDDCTNQIQYCHKTYSKLFN